MKKILLKLLILSATFLLQQKSQAQNLLTDGTFNTTDSIMPYYTDPPPLNMWLSWANYYGTGASFTTNVKDGVCSYFIENPGTNMFDVQLTQYGFPLIVNHRYRLSFDVKADADRDFGVFIGEYGVFSGSWINLNPSYTRHATAGWQTITIDLDATAVFALNKLSFEMGIQKINMYFANISLTDLGPIPLDKVVVAGTFQSEIGCTSLPNNYFGDWDANCDFTALTFNSSTGLWTGSFNIPAGCHQYKVTINGSWDVNYGENGIQGGTNINMYIPSQTLITFTYDPTSHIVTTSPIASGFSANCLPQVVLAGSFQSVIGCSSDWDANCLNTALVYSATSGLFENDFNIPQGYYEYRVVLNGDWAGESFGVGGLPNGNNYNLYNYCNAKIHFTYNPVTHVVQATNAQPNAVVIAGSFQSELGCSGDWQPDCNYTRMHFNSGAWVDTLDIPAGHWEYKITINNSWDENYGQNGRNGDNISLDLCYPAKVAFIFNYDACYPYSNAQIITNGICVNKFYDANVDGYPNYGEEPMSGVSFTVTGNGIKQTQTTGTDGKAAFTNLPEGIYVVKENVPSGYYTTGIDSQYVYVFSNSAAVYFGNVCIGAGGGKGMGYWTNKNGETALRNSGKMEDVLWQLRNWSLRNADGTDFDPYTYAQLKTWLMEANAKNMTYMLSAQLATMFLNTELGYVNGYNSYIYTPGCAWWGNFMNVNNLVYYTNYYLSYNTTVDGKNPVRDYLECLKTAFDNANSNLTFVQPHPCSGAVTNAETRRSEEATAGSELTAPRIGPNPTNNYFTLHPPDNGKNEAFALRVYNANGQQVYNKTGLSDKDFRFGEKLVPGIYLVEFIQGDKRTSFKVVKQ